MITLEQDPLFDETVVCSRVQNLWMQLQAAHIEEDLKPLKPYFSASLYQREEAQLRDAQKVDRIRQTVRPAILNWTMTYEGIRQGREVLNCHLLTRSRPLEIKKSSGVTVAGGQETFYREDWILSRPSGTKTPPENSAVTVHCPGCGASMSLYKSAVCPFCGKTVRVPDFTWTVEEITQKRELHP